MARRIAKPIAPKPRIMSAQVAGSGTPPEANDRNTVSPLLKDIPFQLIASWLPVTEIRDGSIPVAERIDEKTPELLVKTSPLNALLDHDTLGAVRVSDELAKSIDIGRPSTVTVDSIPLPTVKVDGEAE